MTAKRNIHKVAPVLALLVLVMSGCVTMPTGPSRMALPGTNKSFDEFRADDASCRQYALENAGGTPAQVQESSAVKSAVVGTVVGAAAGAALGGSGRGAATGAGAGLLMGAAGGAAAGDQSGYLTQRRYDDGYTQCMYAKGHRVAIPGGMTERPAAPQPYYAPPPGYVLPPPPGSAPPPPAMVR